MGVVRDPSWKELIRQSEIVEWSLAKYEIFKLRNNAKASTDDGFETDEDYSKEESNLVDESCEDSEEGDPLFERNFSRDGNKYLGIIMLMITSERFNFLPIFILMITSNIANLSC